MTGGRFGLTIQGSGNDTIALTRGVVTLTLSHAGGSVAVSGNLGAASVSTAATAFDVALNGGTNTVTGSGTFSNTGTLAICSAAGTRYSGIGWAATAPFVTSTKGTISTTNSAIALGPVT